MAFYSELLTKQVEAIISSEEIYGGTAFVFFVKNIDDSRIEGVFIDALTNEVFKFSVLANAFEFSQYLTKTEQENLAEYTRRVDAFNAGFSSVVTPTKDLKSIISSRKNLNKEREKAKRTDIKDIQSLRLRNQIMDLFDHKK